MIDPNKVQPVEADETVARHVLHRSHIRLSNNTLKQDAFVPHPYQDLSVTRHLLATDEELWTVGESVATATGKTLYGRGDIRANACTRQKLIIRAAPVDGNPNHANVSGWPTDKPAQKAIAQELAAAAHYVPKGTTPDRPAG